MNKIKMILSLGCIGSLLEGAAPAQSPVTITLTGATTPGFEVPADFTGLSFETQSLLPDVDGKYLFGPANRPLITLFQTLGIKILRVGGNTADRPGVPVPGPADIDSLFAFARAADVKVIYTLRLRNGSATNAATTAQYIAQRYQPQLACFAIGNEPNFYFKTYVAYHDEWIKYAAAIKTEVPDAEFCGPSAGGYPVWSHDFANDFGKSEPIAFIAQHDYPCGNGMLATDIAAAQDKMLAPQLQDEYRSMWRSFVPAALSNGVPFRFEEANSFYNAGARDVSDTFASALWGLDFLHWWAAHDASGVNFHTGDKVAAGSANRSCWYATFWSSDRGYDVHPIGYAIKAFNLGGHGRVEPLTLSNPDGVNLTAYAIRDGRSLFITLINKGHGAGAKAAQVTLAAPDISKNAAVIFLSAPDNNPAAKTGVTLGGASITDNGWEGKWTPLAPDQTGQCTINMPATSAAILKLPLK
ncbi:MAG TPA: glycosyl hydrolase family 79 C-terminal domain-containing protein [Candidatus Sulfopaludibacter sp.]|nr:glycosyl hydrolase family 79 C-terminal domain-containing protein [Candidatus Sulfopaludibacter sp.]